MDGEIDWQARAERAEAAVAEAREAFKSFECTICDESHMFTQECQACLSGEPSACTCANQEPEPCPCCMTGEYAEGYKKLRHVLSTTCGSDYVRREELEAARGCLAHTQEALEACERASGFVPGDTSLPQWIANTKAQLDAAKAENARLREALHPFTLLNPTRFASISPENAWLWKPSETNNPDAPGISLAHIDSAKQALAGKEGE